MLHLFTVCELLLGCCPPPQGPVSPDVDASLPNPHNLDAERVLAEVLGHDTVYVSGKQHRCLLEVLRLCAPELRNHVPPECEA